MPEPRRMTGVLRVAPAVAPNGEPQVLTVLPNGAQFLLPPETALTYAFSVLCVARDQFPSKAALDAAVPEAYERIDELLTRRNVQ